MQEFSFDSVDQFTDILIKHYNNDENFTVVGNYDIVSAIFKDILSWENVDIKLVAVDLEDPYLGNYSDEYILTIVNNELFIDKAIDNGVALSYGFEDEPTYFHKDISTSVVMKCNSEKVTVFSIDKIE